MTTLVFPAGMPESLRYLERARRRGEHVIGASSLASDSARPFYPEWAWLPYITDSAFGKILTELVKDRGITSFFSAHPVVCLRVLRLIEQGDVGLEWADGPSLQECLDEYASAKAFVAEMPPLRLGDVKPALPAWERAALLVACERIPGQCSREKILAFAEVFSDLPEGDLVEIGSLWGRSAYALAWLGQQEGTGPLLCVDPWQPYRQDSAGALLNDACAGLDIPGAFEIFRMNLAPFRRRCHYLRETSVEAAKRYVRSPLVLDDPYWGKVDFSGRIALLHIDGNHDFDAVADDLNAWTPLVAPGGWIVVDDYLWPFGDGPRLAADEWMKRVGNRIETAFVAADTLWVRLSGVLKPDYPL